MTLLASGCVCNVVRDSYFALHSSINNRVTRPAGHFVSGHVKSEKKLKGRWEAKNDLKKSGANQNLVAVCPKGHSHDDSYVGVLGAFVEKSKKIDQL